MGRFQLFIFQLCCLIQFIFASIPTVKLNSNQEMPVVGLGTWQIKHDDVDVVITTAMESGYVHIDTAHIYTNEDAIGKSLKKWFDNGGKREDLFITSKLPPYGNRASDVEKYLKLALEKLGVQYLDMYLIHQSYSFVKDPNDDYEPATYPNGSVILDIKADPILTWKAMEAQVKAGRTKNIGLSNFNESQISNIINNSEIKPSNLQVEFHLYNQQKALRKFCKEHNIVITGYSTLGSPGTDPNKKKRTLIPPMQHPTVKKIAQIHNKTPAHVLLRHALQNDVVVLPKSIHANRIRSNIQLFDFKLTEDEMKQLNKLDMGEDGRMFNFQKIFIGVENHPQYAFKDQLSPTEH